MELLVVLCLIAMFGSYAVFRMPQLVQQKQSTAALQDLRATINYARHAAIVRGEPVVVCPAAESGCGPRNTWHTGVLTFVDRNGNRAFDAADTLLTRTPPISTGRIYWRAFRNRSYLLFTPRGITDWQNGHLLYCPFSGDPRHARQLVLNVTGRTYASRDANGDGIHEDVRGRALSCPA